MYKHDILLIFLNLYLQSGGRNNVTEEHGGQGIFVGEKSVESVGGHLVKGGVGGGKHGEGTFAGQSLDEIGGLDGGEEGRELRGGDHQLGDGLGGGGGLHGNGSRIVVNRGLVNSMDIMLRVLELLVVNLRLLMVDQGLLMVDQGLLMVDHGVVGSVVSVMNGMHSLVR